MQTPPHVHVVLAEAAVTETASRRKLLAALMAHLPADHIHVLVSPESTHEFSEVQRIVEPHRRGGSAAVAYAACQLYLQDPNSLMVYLDGTGDVAALLGSSWDAMLAAAELPGALVSLEGTSGESPAACWLSCGPLVHADGRCFSGQVVCSQPDSENSQVEWLPSAGVYAWSVFALMETYRHYVPVEFQALNELARTWGRSAEQRRALYEKLSSRSPASLLLSQVQDGYSTRNIVVRRAPASAPASWSGNGAVTTATVREN